MRTYRYSGILYMHSELSHGSPWTAETINQFLTDLQEVETVERTAREKQLGDLIPNKGLAKPNSYVRYVYGTAVGPDGSTREVRTWAVSGNLVRALLRRYIVRHTLDVLEVKFSEVPRGVLQGLLSGGVLKKGLAPRPVKPHFLVEVRQWLPVVDVFGGVFNGVQIPGCLRCGFSIPVIEETLPAFFRDSDFTWMVEAAREHYGGRMASFGESYGKSRVSAYTRHHEIDTGGVAGGEDGQAGLYVVQSVPAAGLCLGHSIRLVAPFGEKSEKCLLAALALFNGAGVIGGKSGIGYGFFTADYKRVSGGRAEDLDLDAALHEYEDWLKANKEQITVVLKAMSDHFKYAIPDDLRKGRVLFSTLADVGLIEVLGKAYDEGVSEDEFADLVSGAADKIVKVCSGISRYPLGLEAEARARAALTPETARALRKKLTQDVGAELFEHMAANCTDESAAYDVEALYPTAEDVSGAQKKAGSALKSLTDFFVKLPNGGSSGRMKNRGDVQEQQ